MDQELRKQNRGKNNRGAAQFLCLYNSMHFVHRNKEDELELLKQDGKHNLIDITETWLDETHD